MAESSKKRVSKIEARAQAMAVVVVNSEGEAIEVAILAASMNWLIITSHLAIMEVLGARN